MTLIYFKQYNKNGKLNNLTIETNHQRYANSKKRNEKHAMILSCIMLLIVNILYKKIKNKR